MHPVTDHFLNYDVPVALTTSQPGIRALDYIEEKPLIVGTANSEILLMNEEGKFLDLVQVSVPKSKF